MEYGPSGVKVTTASGDVYEADFALMTFCVGVLQHDAVKFTPELPRSVAKKADVGKFLRPWLHGSPVHKTNQMILKQCL